VVFQVLARHTVTYVVSGSRCADGAPLGFWYGHDGPPPHGSAGEPSATLPPAPDVVRPGRLGRGGYVLFPAPGRYRFDFAAPGVPVESVVLDVEFG
jgi:hypothetical protein